MISQLFQTLIYEPLFNALILIYSLLPNLGLSVILLTGLIKLLTLPLNTRAFRLQQIMAGIQLELKSVQKKYKDKPEEQAKAVSEIFKREKVSPLGPLMPVLIQLPILIALYHLFWQGLWSETNHLYSFISKPEVINPLFLGINLSQPNIILAVLAGIAQLVQTLMLPKPVPKNNNSSNELSEKMSSVMQKQMMYLFPVLTIFILLKLPSALGLYWLVTSIFSVCQQYFLNKSTPKI